MIFARLTEYVAYSSKQYVPLYQRLFQLYPRLAEKAREAHAPSGTDCDEKEFFRGSNDELKIHNQK
jgi:hypothetical protein